MLLARVVSPLWGAQRASGLQGYKLLELETPQGARLGVLLMESLDALGVGGEDADCAIVLDVDFAAGLVHKPFDVLAAEVPDKDIIIAIVDGMDGEIGSGTGSEVSR